MSTSTIVNPSDIGLELPLLGLDDDFPENIYILKDKNKDKYACYHLTSEGIYGLMCFEHNSNAASAKEDFQHKDILEITQTTFDEAREIAKERPLPVTCLLLMDNPISPKIHFVK